MEASETEPIVGTTGLDPAPDPDPALVPGNIGAGGPNEPNQPGVDVTASIATSAPPPGPDGLGDLVNQPKSPGVNVAAPHATSPPPASPLAPEAPPAE